MAIFRDISDPSILVKCTDCPWWFAIRLNRLDAYRVGESHEVNVHGVEPARAAEPRVLYEKRHAAKV